jgi:hypothetical protein
LGDSAQIKRTHETQAASLASAWLAAA